MEQKDLMDITMLKRIISSKDTGVLFVFGSSFISRIIQAKTRNYKSEIVPSHVAMIVKGKFLYESTSAREEVGDKTIPAGVRRYLLTDFFRAERKKESKYYFVPAKLDNEELEKYVHLPYGKDIILDFVLKDGSDGESRGLICSQYGNNCAKVLDKDCPNPAELFRAMINEEDN